MLSSLLKGIFIWYRILDYSCFLSGLWIYHYLVFWLLCCYCCCFENSAFSLISDSLKVICCFLQLLLCFIVLFCFSSLLFFFLPSKFSSFLSSFLFSYLSFFLHPSRPPLTFSYFPTSNSLLFHSKYFLLVHLLSSLNISPIM